MLLYPESGKGCPACVCDRRPVAAPPAVNNCPDVPKPAAVAAVAPVAASPASPAVSAGSANDEDVFGLELHDVPRKDLDYGKYGANHYQYREARLFASFANLGSDKANFHQYHMLYAKVLWPFRREMYHELRRKGLKEPTPEMLDPTSGGKKFKMMEVGLGCNMQVPFGGMHIFRRYLPNVKYHNYEYFPDDCLRLNEKHKKEGLEVTEQKYIDYLWNGALFKGDQSNEANLEAATRKFGQMDLIIEDGSHIIEHQKISFRYLFKHMLKPGGTYVVEDLQTNLWPSVPHYGFKNYAGGKNSHTERETMIDYLQNIIMTMSLRGADVPSRREYLGKPFDQDTDITDWIQDITCDREICAVQKKLEPFNLFNQQLKL